MKFGRVTIVGRMNVGKSTLFNRLSSSVKSITLDYAGVTRDFLKDIVEWQDAKFELIDTGGIVLEKTQDVIQQKVQQKVFDVLSGSDLILFVVDGSVGLTLQDDQIAKILYKLSKPVLLVINKEDVKESSIKVYEFQKLGFKNSVLISAQHGTSIYDLLDLIILNLPYEKEIKDVKPECKVVFLGRPNVGKSSLLNAILDSERTIVSDIPGTTREPISEIIKYYSKDIMLTDTPGIRRKRSIEENLEEMMVHGSFEALKDSDIVVMLIDATQAGLVDQELKLAFYAFEKQNKSLILLINKADLMSEEDHKNIITSLDYYKHLVKKIPVLYISCKTGKNVGKVLTLIDKVYKRSIQEFSKIDLEKYFLQAFAKKPFHHSMRTYELYGVEQIKTLPITILLRVNHPEWFEKSHVAYFENLMRSEYDLVGTAIKFILKK